MFVGCRSNDEGVRGEADFRKEVSFFLTFVGEKVKKSELFLHQGDEKSMQIMIAVAVKIIILCYHV